MSDIYEAALADVRAILCEVEKYDGLELSRVAKDFDESGKLVRAEIIIEFREQPTSDDGHNGRIRCGDGIMLNDEPVVVTGLSFPGGKVEAIWVEPGYPPPDGYKIVPSQGVPEVSANA